MPAVLTQLKPAFSKNPSIQQFNPDSFLPRRIKIPLRLSQSNPQERLKQKIWFATILDKALQVSNRITTIFDFRIEYVINKMHLTEI
jgi:hypothetical protein